MSLSVLEHRSVFVSSTFRDMHGERDMIRDLVLPQLSEFAEQNFTDVDFVDLRWGISTADVSAREDKERRVLTICLDRIDETRPFMIVLLGDRYGWIPDKSLLEFAVEGRNFQIKNAESVTALEIEYVLLSDKELMTHCYFYFRELNITVAVMVERKKMKTCRLKVFPDKTIKFSVPESTPQS